MKLNRNNYEEYFILYLDNELGSEDRREVENFANENPDLKAELDILLQSKFSPDTNITFNNKESLMAGDSSSISMNNYEEWLLSYADNELTKEETKDIERFMAAHPAVKKELTLLQQVKLQPESIIFPYKESLYRKEEKVRVVAISWRRIAVAAVLLIGISTTAILFLNKPDKDQDGVAATNPGVENSIDSNAIELPGNIPPEKQENIARTDIQQVETPSVIPVDANKKEKVAKQPSQVKPQEAVIVNVEPEKKPGNNLPQPEHNPYVKGQANLNNGTTASITPKATLTIPQENTGIASVTPDIIQTSQLSTPDDEDGVEQPTGKKNKLRGFFRKVTRTFEKKTNIKATDDDDRLLIAGLAIKLN